MEPIQRNEILPLGEYEMIREPFRARVIEAKRLRRVAVSDIMSATFENRDTVLLQIQEMLRTERITSEDGIRHEIETYNDLIPEAGQLSFTLFVEIAEKTLREEMLEKLAGLEQHVAVEVDGERFPAESKERAAEGYTRTTAVHYFKAKLNDAAVSALASGRAKLALRVDHPAYAARAELSTPATRSVAADLA
jgi:hypothetical protein